MTSLSVQYRFRIKDDAREIFQLEFDPESLELKGNIPDILPDWTRLDFFQCPNCPLTLQTHPNCPMAANLVKIVQCFDTLKSFDEIEVKVITLERQITQVTSAQKAISSMMGLVMAASGCPRTAFFKPMARFHLPLANEKETIFRATSMYMLAQYFLKKEGRPADFELKGLQKIYRGLQIINTYIARRLREATRTDSSINAVILLDIYAQTLPMAIEKSLEDIRYMFEPFLKESILAEPVESDE